MTVIVFIIVLAVLIFVHELGHFLLAKICGIRVDAFAIGFGPKIFSIKKGETLYSLNIIPFGGYVKIFGEDPNEESLAGPDRERSIVNKPRYKQVLVLIAGVFFNFLFAWLIYSGIFFHGVTASSYGFEKYVNNFHDSRVIVTNVLPNSPADKVNIKAGDNIVSIYLFNEDSKWIDLKKEINIDDIQNTINSSEGREIIFEYRRNNEEKVTKVTVAPIKGLVNDRYAIGIAMQDVVDLKLPFFASIYEGAHYTVVMIRETSIGIYDFLLEAVKGKANFSQVSGPVGIANIVGDAADMGFVYLLMITAIISINLGVINLVPFPALDGGRVLFVIIESIIRKRIPHRFANIVNAIGFALLMALMIFVTYKDIARLIN